MKGRTMAESVEGMGTLSPSFAKGASASATGATGDRMEGRPALPSPGREREIPVRGRDAFAKEMESSEYAQSLVAFSNLVVGATPLGLACGFRFTQGGSLLATLGFATESLGDSTTGCPSFRKTRTLGARNWVGVKLKPGEAERTANELRINPPSPGLWRAGANRNCGQGEKCNHWLHKLHGRWNTVGKFSHHR